jgi:hypothetical protein
MRRLRSVLLLLLLGSAAAVLFRQRGARKRLGVDVYFEDGSLTSFDEKSADGARLLSLACEVRRAAVG